MMSLITTEFNQRLRLEIRRDLGFLSLMLLALWLKVLIPVMNFKLRLIAFFQDSKRPVVLLASVNLTIIINLTLRLVRAIKRMVFVKKVLIVALQETYG